MELKEFKVGDVSFTIPVWKLGKALANEKYFLPLIEGPIINGAAIDMEEDENLAMAALISGVIEGLKEVDMTRVCEIALEGVGVKFGETGAQSASLALLEKNDVDLATVHLLIAAIIKVNYGSVLKKDLGDSLQVLMDL